MTTELRRRLQQLVLRDVQVTCEGSPEAVDWRWRSSPSTT